MYNLTDVNLNKQVTLNHRDYNNEHCLVTPESKGENRKHTVSQVDNQPPINNPSHTHCSSTPVQERAVKQEESINRPTKLDIDKQSIKDFDDLIAPYRFIEMKQKSCTFGKNYNGKPHCLYSLLVKSFVQNKNHLNTHQLNQLLLVLEDHNPEDCWTWQSLTTAFASWNIIGLFLDNNDLFQGAQQIQKKLFKAFLYQALKRHKKQPLLPDMTAQNVTSFMITMTQLQATNLKIEMAPGIIKILIIMCLHVKTMVKKTFQKKEYRFNKKQISTILGNIGTMVQSGCCGLQALKNTQPIKDAVTTLLTLMITKTQSTKKTDHLNALETTYLLYSIAKMKNNGLLTDTTILNQSVAVLCSLAFYHKDWLNAHNLGNVLWASVELGGSELLDPKNIKTIKVMTVMLLPHVTAQAQAQSQAQPEEKLNTFHTQKICDILYSIVQLLELNLLVLLEVKDSLQNLVGVLLPLIVKQKGHIHSKILTSLLSTIAKLESWELNEENTQKLEDTLVALLPCAQAKLKSKKESDQFSPLGISILLWTIAKLAYNCEKLSKSELNQFVTLLLPLINKQMAKFATHSLRNIAWSIVKLLDSSMHPAYTRMFRETVTTLLPLLEAKAKSTKEEDSFSAHGLANHLWAIAKLGPHMTALNRPIFGNLITTLLFHLDAQKNKMLHRSIANLLWAIASLGELIEIQRAVALSVFLVDKIKTYKMFNKAEKMMSLWGLLACRIRSYSSGNVNNSDTLQNNIEMLFYQMKDDLFENYYDKTTLLMTSVWLGKRCHINQSYEIVTSRNQCDIYHALSKKFPSLNIKEEEVLHALPPVDLYLPEHRIVIEVQGPYHYVCGDFKTKNGSTLLKIGLLEKLRYDVIEIPMPPGFDSISIQEGIDRIQKKIKSAGAEIVDDRSISDSEKKSSDNEYLTADEDSEYFTASEDNDSSNKAYSNKAYSNKASSHKDSSNKDSSDTLYINNANLSINKEQETEEWQEVTGKKKKKRRMKAKKQILSD